MIKSGYHSKKSDTLIFNGYIECDVSYSTNNMQYNCENKCAICIEKYTTMSYNILQ